jgi:two-component system cell cycle response regulator
MLSFWENFSVRRIFGYRGEDLKDYFDDLELARVLPRVLQYAFSHGECENAVWIVAEEYERLKLSRSTTEPLEPEQLLHRELKIQAIQPVSEAALVAHIAKWEGASDRSLIYDVEGKSHLALPIRGEKDGVELGYVLLIGVPTARAAKVRRRLSRDLGHMAKHLRFSLQHWQAQRLSFLDDLTSLYNQKYMGHVLENEIHRAQRERSKFSVLFMDVDYFKSVNDTRGHWVGSRLLVEVGRVVRNCIRKSDYAFRYGGDEFVVVLPATDATQAIVAAERIRAVVEKTEFLIEGEPVRLTLSIGLATYPDHAKTYKDIIKMADEAMYCGKNKSRNIVFVAS